MKGFYENTCQPSIFLMTSSKPNFLEEICTEGGQKLANQTADLLFWAVSLFLRRCNCFLHICLKIFNRLCTTLLFSDETQGWKVIRWIGGRSIELSKVFELLLKIQYKLETTQILSQRPGFQFVTLFIYSYIYSFCT